MSDENSFEKYVDFALDVPMYFVTRNNKTLDASGESFRNFLTGN
jgi:glutamate--cysteine ligase